MKKYVLMVSAVLTALVLASCASAPKTESKVSVQEDLSGKTVSVTDWSNRTFDEVSKPEWLKKLIQGNSKVFVEQFSVSADNVIKYSVGTAKSRDASLAASRVNYNAMRAEELKTKVVSEAAATLNDEGFTEATSNAATLAKVDLSGHELVTQFWQEVKTTDKEAGTSKTEYICYSVYKISKENWLNTLKSYMTQIIPAIPDSKAQVKMANTIQSLYDDTTKEQEKSEAETKAAIQAQVELARIDANKEVAKAQASQPVVVQQSAPQNEGVDWMNALELAANVIF